jgi:exosortase A
MSAVLDMPSRDSAWRQSLTWLALLMALVLGIYRDTAVAMVTIWSRSDTFAHAFLVPPIVLWLMWRKRKALAPIVPAPQPWVLVPFAAVALLWFTADLVAVNAATQFALVAMLVLTVPAVLGLQVAWQLLFPLTFAFFCVPFGEFVMPQLMQWTADFTVAALQLSGIPVYREGLQFVIPTGNWSVVEACSGVRYLIASFMVGTLFAYLNYRSWQRRLAFGVVSLLVPVLANWVRAYLIVMIGHLSGNKLAVGVDHLIFGWVFFGVVIMLMFLIGARWSEAEAPAPQPNYANREPGNSGAWPAWVVSMMLVVLLLLPQGALWWVDRNESQTEVALRLPADLAKGWHAGEVPAVSWKPHFDNPSAESAHSYVNQGPVVGLYIAYYRRQDYGRKLVSSENVFVTTQDKVWAQVAHGQHQSKLGAKTVDWRTAWLRGSPHPDQRAEERLTAWQTYWVGGTLTNSDAKAKLIAAWHRALGRGDDSAAIVIYTTDPSGQAAQALLEEFATANLDAIDAQLRATRDAK